jgi:hypothetical protein
MLEIIALIFLVRSASNAAKAKGRSPGWAAVPVGMWVGLEAIVVAMMLASGAGRLAVAGVGFMTGIGGGLIGYLIVRGLSDSLPVGKPIDASVFD